MSALLFFGINSY